MTSNRDKVGVETIEAAAAESYKPKGGGNDEANVLQNIEGMNLEDFEEQLKDVSSLEDEILTEEERLHPWKQTPRLFILVAFAALGAFIVGVDISLVSGAEIQFMYKFKIANKTNLLGLTTSATTLGALVGSMAAIILNDKIGRRGTLLIAGVWSVGSALWEALAPSWAMLLVGRLMLGISMGMISSTVPILLAEAVPTAIRGAIASLYQQLVATGWRLMLGTTLVPGAIETVGKHEHAMEVLKRLRISREHALRDYVIIRKACEEESRMTAGKNMYFELVRVPSLRRALFVGVLLMLFQQYCGMNVFMYYVDYMFKTMIHVSSKKAVLASMVAGFANAVFTIPVYWTIDKYGRRSLQLWTFPVMCAMQVLALFSYYGTKWVNFALFIIAIFFFIAAYSPANGPVPWVYNAEIFPLYIRSEGMAITTFTNYMFNFVVSFSWPDMLKSMKAQGGYGFYAAAIAWGWVMLFFFMPETKGYTLEQMRLVFEHSLGEIAKYHWHCGVNNVKRVLGMKNVNASIPSPYDKAANLKEHGIEEEEM
ncbi:Arabinose-proton symporter [Galdieria sulphuraria]|nr:Arabinose-proton symporter [Galdieria sulphuraria]